MGMRKAIAVAIAAPLALAVGRVGPEQSAPQPLPTAAQLAAPGV